MLCASILTLGTIFVLAARAPIVTSRPVCSNYPPLQVSDWIEFGVHPKNYSYLHGEPTNEFWEVLAEYYDQLGVGGDIFRSSINRIGKIQYYRRYCYKFRFCCSKNL